MRRAAACATLGALAAMMATGLTSGFVSAAGAQTATFSSRRDAVRVDVLVREGGRIVRNLQPSDFEVLDNGVAQQVDLATFEELPLNVVLALDVSESVRGERLDHLKRAGGALLDALTGEDHAGLMTFSHRVALRQHVTANWASVRAALASIEAGGETSLVEGIHAAMTLAASGHRRDLLVVFTDGHDTSSFLGAAEVLESARFSGVTVYGVSVRGSGPAAFLRDLAALTGGQRVEIESARDLQPTFVAILEEFRQRYLLSYTPRGVSSAGWHRLQVRVKGRRADVTARAGYVAGS